MRRRERRIGKRFCSYIRNETTAWCAVNIETEDGSFDEITSTLGHKYFLPFNNENREVDEIHEHTGYNELSAKWVSACNLKIGDKVLLFDGKHVVVKKVEIRQLDVPETTYNFEVADFHTYYVGEQSVCVHNKGCSLVPDPKCKRCAFYI
jgi:hypothetical protein